MTTRRWSLAATAALLGAVTLLASCGPDESGEQDALPSAAPLPTPTDTGAAASEGQDTVQHHSTKVRNSRPLRRGEERLTLTMPEPYTPEAPTGVGTDDYRCFLLDPGLQRDAFLTGTQVLPGNRDVVHHVILFRVPAEQVAGAEEKDASEDGPGWTCFGGAGLDEFADADDAAWLGAWAPGSRESVFGPGLGVALDAGSRIVMQVHYNLLAGDAPDVSATQLRLAPGKADISPVGTMLLPGPVELPCRPGRDSSPLCDRDAALADVKARFGDQAGSLADLLHLICGSPAEPGNTQSCTRTLSEPTTILGAAGHMHLLGRAIRIDVNPGTDRARTVLDIPVWDFDNQTARPVEPVHLGPGDQVRVTCRHGQRLRDRLPAFEGQQERYVVWGEGTTDEMCLGILQVTHP